MKRTLLCVSVLFAAGCGLACAAKTDKRYIAILILLALCLSCYRFVKRRQSAWLIYLLVFLCGFYLCAARLDDLAQRADPITGRHVTADGQISGEVKRNGSMSTYVLYVDSIEADGKSYGRNIKVKVVDYKNDGGYIVPFNHLLLSGNMDSGESFKNSGCFSYRFQLMREGISGVIVADHMPGIRTSPSSKRPVEKFIGSVKAHAKEKMDRYLNSTSASLMKGILFGDISEISESEYSSFEDSGIIHVFAVSGYNIWLLYMILNHALFFLTRKKALKELFVVCAMGFYVMLSGCSPSVLRSFIMSSTVIFGRLLGRKGDPLTSLSLSAVLILLFNPLMIADAGFQLSYACVASIILLYPKFERIRLPFSRLRKLIATYLSVQVGILPIAMYYFNRISLLSILGNIIVVPLVSLLTIFGVVFLISPALNWGIPHFLGLIINGLGSVVLGITDTISRTPNSCITVASPTIPQMIVYYLAVCCLTGIVKLNIRQRRRAALSVISVIIFALIFENSASRLVISFIDVGQGDCILITTPDRKHVLIDGGGKINSSYSALDIGEDVVVPYLLRHGIRNIDMVISTHSDDDHLKGLIPVISTLETGTFVKPDAIDSGYASVLKSGIIGSSDVAEVSKGDFIKAGRYVNIYVLGPDHRYEEENDCSLVLRLAYRNFSALFTGDIGIDAENGLNGAEIKSDLLKVPHHGSINSFNSDFIGRVDPEAAVICVGRNSFGHPSDTVVGEIAKRGIKLFRTDTDGEITVTSDGYGFKIKTFK